MTKNSKYSKLHCPLQAPFGVSQHQLSFTFSSCTLDITTLEDGKRPWRKTTATKAQCGFVHTFTSGPKLFLEWVPLLFQLQRNVRVQTQEKRGIGKSLGSPNFYFLFIQNIPGLYNNRILVVCVLLLINNLPLISDTKKCIPYNARNVLLCKSENRSQ